MIKQISVICLTLLSASVLAQETTRLYSDCNDTSCELRNSTKEHLSCSITLTIGFHSPTLGHVTVTQREAALIPKYKAYKIIPYSKSYPDIAFSNMGAYADCFPNYTNQLK